ncbi:MAG: hypothetical protein OXF93_03835 [Acidobacteria bacterium]|nr:hypothetical protein [Acidobacteriota bacterium]
MRLKQALVALLVVVLLFGRPAAVDASWAGMLVQVTAVLSQIRGYVQTAEAYVAQAHAEVRGLLDPGGLVSGVRSLADWRGVLAELTDLGPLWEPFPETRALVSDAAANYHAVRGLGGHDFGSVAGFVDFLDSQPFGWTAGKESAWQVLVDDLGLPAELRDEVRSADQLRRRVIDLRYASTVDTRLAAAAVLGDHVAGEYAGRGLLEDTAGVLDATRRVMGGRSDPDPALSQAEADSAASQLASLGASQSAGALSLRAARLAAEARDVRLDAYGAATHAQQRLDRLAYLASAAAPAMEESIGGDPMGALGSGEFMEAWVR